MTRGRQIFHSSGGRTTSRQGSYTPPTKIPNDDLDDLIASDDTTQVPHTVDSHATQVLSPIDTQPSTRIPPSPQYHANTSTSCSDDASTSTAGTAGSVSGRPMISVRGKPFDLYPSQICSKVVGKIFKSKVDMKGYNRKHVPIYREEFKKKDRGTESSAAELYVVTHTRKGDGKTFLSERDRQFYESYEKVIEEASQPAPGTSEPSYVDHNQVFLETRGVINHGRFDGVASASSFLYPDIASTSTVGSRAGYMRTEIDARLRESQRRIDQMQQKFAESERWIMEARQREEEFRRKYDEQLAMQSRKIAELKSGYESKLTDVMKQMTYLVGKLKRRKGSKKGKGKGKGSGSTKAPTKSDTSSDEHAS